MSNQFLYIPNDEQLYSPAKEGQTVLVKNPSEIAAESYPLSVRNIRNVYEIPIDTDRVYLNFNAIKVFITDELLRKIDDDSFTFFVDPPVPEPIKYELPDGMIFRCLGEPLNDLRGYTYFIKENGIVKQIPDYKTVEVELAKRGVSYTYVQVLTEQQCADVKGTGGVAISNSEAAAWSDELGNSTGYNTLANLSSNLATLAGITAQLGASTAQEQTNINNNLAAQAAAQGASQASAASAALSAGAGQSAAAASAAAAGAAQAAAQASATEAANSAASTEAAAAAATANAAAAAAAAANAQNGII